MGSTCASLPTRGRSRPGFPERRVVPPGCRSPPIADWEDRHGYQLAARPAAWLRLSNGLFGGGPLIHPITAIGPMIPFARVPEMLVQPESWFELGNPDRRRSASTWPIACRAAAIRSSRPATMSRAARPGSSRKASRSGFSSCCGKGGGNTGLTAGFADFGDPWQSHRRHVAHPRLSHRLRLSPSRSPACCTQAADERMIASGLGLSRCDVESIFRHLQHARPTSRGLVRMTARDVDSALRSG